MAISLMIFASGCNKENMNSTGKMGVRMTDSPAEFDAMMVEITQVEAYLDGEGWVNLASDIGQVNILSLTNGTEVALAQNLEVEAGLYTMIRISFGSDNSLKLNIGGITSTVALTMQSDAVIEINQELKADENASFLLDFQAGKSVTETALGFVCDPVITYVKDEDTGVQGKLEASAKGHIEFSNSSASYESFSNANGEFLLRGMDSGIYTCTIHPQNTDIYPSEVTLQNIVVVNGQVTQMGTIQLK
ncbi:MAG: DUF4382 domain-containing protein [Bacteroidia bacterium]|nr:DUF4382 domain-containing protein [Bacteroidia bacterium]